MRVLYSFPHRIGADRICSTAWEQVQSVIKEGVSVTLMCASVARPVDTEAITTLSRGQFRAPYRFGLGKFLFRVHDHIVASWLEKHSKEIDLVHGWPQGSLRTFKVARRLGIPTVMERANAHTRVAIDLVKAECAKLELPLHPEYAHPESVIRFEEEEFHASDYLLCASEFSKRTFLQKGFPEERLLRHFYGFDDSRFHSGPRNNTRFIATWVGVDPVRKGLHTALDAWLMSAAHLNGIFFILGKMDDRFRRKYAEQLSDPSVVYLGSNRDVADIFRKSDVLIFPSIEEGFGLVCTEAMASGCVPIVSNACTDKCVHGRNSLVCDANDTVQFWRHIDKLYHDKEMLRSMRDAALADATLCTWRDAGKTLSDIYRSVVLNAPPSRSL